VTRTPSDPKSLVVSGLSDEPKTVFHAFILAIFGIDVSLTTAAARWSCANAPANSSTTRAKTKIRARERRKRGTRMRRAVLRDVIDKSSSPRLVADPPPRGGNLVLFDGLQPKTEFRQIWKIVLIYWRMLSQRTLRV